MTVLYTCCAIFLIQAPAAAQETAAASAEEPEAGREVYSAMYLGTGGGAVVMEVDTSDGRTLAAEGHDYNVYVGGGYQPRGTRLYLGGEVHGLFGIGDLQSTESVSSSDTTAAIGRDSQETWGASGLLGLVVSPAMMMYGRGGYSRAEFGSDKVSGIHYGMGADAVLTQALALRTEWTHTRYDRLAGSGAAPGTRLSTDQFQLSLLWRFGAPEPEPAAADTRIDTGVYFGTGAGYQAGGYENNGLCALPPAQTCTTNYQGELALNGISGNAFIGFGVRVGEKYYTALEVNYGRLLQDDEEHSYATNNSASLDLEQEGAASVIAGRLFRPDLLVYTRLGYQRGRFAYRSSDSSHSDDLSGIVFGIGTETAIRGRIFARMEWQYLDYKTWQVDEGTNLVRALRDQDQFRVLASVGIRM